MPTHDETTVTERQTGEDGSSSVHSAIPAVLDDWELDDEIDSARWLVTLSHARHPGDGPHADHELRSTGFRPPAGSEPPGAYEEDAHEGNEPIGHGGRIRSSYVNPADDADSTGDDDAASTARRWSSIGWLVATLGLSAVACGSILAGWSLVGSRGELWHVGLPMALAGQVAAVIGLMLLVDSPSRRQRSHAPHLVDSRDSRSARDRQSLPLPPTEN